MTYVIITAVSVIMFSTVLNRYLMKINRVFVWVLLLFLILLTVSGYGLSKPNLIHSLTGGLVDFRTASYLHNVLIVPFLILSLIHIIIEVKFSLTRWGFKNQKLLNLLMLMLGIAIVLLIAYVDGVSS